jgi:GAF domain-containing protein
MAVFETLSFPDLPRGNLDVVLDDLVVRAHEVLHVESRLRSLLRANKAIVGHAEPDVLLHRIVTSAAELVDAEHGALGVFGLDGSVEKLVTIGVAPQEITVDGEPPWGIGWLGKLFDEQHMIRLKAVAEDARSVGASRTHPDIGNSLTVPIRIRDEVFANLYLTSHPSGTFDLDDEQLMTALAATAGVVIENARFFAESLRRLRWSNLAQEFTSVLLSNDETRAIPHLVDRILDIADADVVWVLTFSANAEQMQFQTACGIDQDLLVSQTMNAAGTVVAAVIEGKQPAQIADGPLTGFKLSDDRSIGPVMAVPMTDGEQVMGVLFVGRLSGRPRFPSSELEMVAHFAGQASIAFKLADARQDKQK